MIRSQAVKLIIGVTIEATDSYAQSIRDAQATALNEARLHYPFHEGDMTIYDYWYTDVTVREDNMHLEWDVVVEFEVPI